MKRTARISVTVFPQELTMIKHIAKKLNMPVSGLLRDALTLWLAHFGACTNEDEYNALALRMKI